MSLQALRYAVVDTEFTSLDARSNRLLSIGGVVMEGAKIRVGEQFYRVVNPGEPVPLSSVLVHQLRSEDVQAGEPLTVVLDDLLKFLDGSVMVGHFVGIDVKILNKELGEGQKLRNPAVDTARVHQWLLRHGRYSEDLPTQLEHLDLFTLARAYSLEVREAHHALEDAFLTACVWQHMIHRLEGKGIQTLGKLLRIGGA
jgi:DNA polymerase-3 subunit epsilon